MTYIYYNCSLNEPLAQARLDSDLWMRYSGMGQGYVAGEAGPAEGARGGTSCAPDSARGHERSDGRERYRAAPV